MDDNEIVMQIRVVFYKANGRWIDQIIRIVTNSSYSHCELLFEDGRMFSSDAWNGGVRWNSNYYLPNWDIVELEVTKCQYDTLIKWCNFKEYSKYDYRGVIRFLIPFIKEDPEKWFCSEVCGAGLKFIGVLSAKIKTSKLSPQGLYDLLKGK